MRKLVLVFVLCFSPVLAAQVIIGVSSRKVFSGGGITPGFVGESSFNSTGTTGTKGGSFNVTTNPSGQVDCSSFALCLPLPDPTPGAGNLVIVPYTYGHSTAVTATGSDDKSNTYTCINGSQDTSGTLEWDGLCYTFNAASATHRPLITFGTTTVNLGSGKSSDWYNVQSVSDPKDASNSCAIASGTSATCSVTTTAANDLVYAVVCRAATPLTDKFTAGSGFTLITEDINDGCASEYEIASSAGSVAAAMTTATSSASTAIEIVIAFKAASAGTAPSGLYMDKLMTWSNLSGNTDTSEKFQFTTSGNLLLMLNSCGTQKPNGTVTDGTNTWANLGSGNVGASQVGPNFGVGGASANATGAITVGLTGTGDCTFQFESYQDGPTSPVFSYEKNGTHAGTAASTWPINCMVQATGTCLGLNPTTDGASWSGWNPAPTLGLLVGVGSQDSNTTTGAPSGCVYDQGSYGGMTISGPGVWINENNPWFHCETNGSLAAMTMAQSQSTLAISDSEIDLIGVWGTGGGAKAGIRGWGENQATSGSSVVVTLGNSVSTVAGDALLVPIQVFNATARTISTVKCNDGATTALSAFTGTTSTGSGHGATVIYELLSAPASCTAVTITASGTIGNLEAEFFDAAGVGGSAWTTDGGTQTTNGTGTAGTCTSGGTACAVTAPAITTTGTLDLCTYAVAVSGSGIISAPQSGNEYTYGNVIFGGDKNGVAALLTTSKSSHQPKLTDGTASDSYSSSHGCLAYN